MDDYVLSWTEDGQQHQVNIRVTDAVAQAFAAKMPTGCTDVALSKTVADVQPVAIQRKQQVSTPASINHELLHAMTIPQLKDLASQANIDLTGLSLKDDIISRIEASSSHSASAS